MVPLDSSWKQSTDEEEASPELVSVCEVDVDCETTFDALDDEIEEEITYAANPSRATTATIARMETARITKNGLLVT